MSDPLASIHGQAAAAAAAAAANAAAAAAKANETAEAAKSDLAKAIEKNKTTPQTGHFGEGSIVHRAVTPSNLPPLPPLLTLNEVFPPLPKTTPLPTQSLKPAPNSQHADGPVKQTPPPSSKLSTGSIVRMTFNRVTGTITVSSLNKSGDKGNIDLEMTNKANEIAKLFFKVKNTVSSAQPNTVSSAPPKRHETIQTLSNLEKNIIASDFHKNKPSFFSSDKRTQGMADSFRSLISQYENAIVQAEGVYGKNTPRIKEAKKLLKEYSQDLEKFEKGLEKETMDRVVKGGKDFSSFAKEKGITPENYTKQLSEILEKLYSKCRMKDKDTVIPLRNLYVQLRDPKNKEFLNALKGDANGLEILKKINESPFVPYLH